MRPRNGIRVAVVASRFHESIANSLVEGAVKTLVKDGVRRDHIETVWVPGAFELPVAASAVAAAHRVDAIVAVGCLIRGQTPQYAAIGHAVAEGLMQVAVTTRVPVGFGVIIAESFAQAKGRAGGHHGNRGSEAASAAVMMARQLRAIGLPTSNGRRATRASHA